MKQVIIAMSGRKAAGKNTVGTFIQQWFADGVVDKCYECSFADNLKNFCIDTLGLKREHCYGTDDQKNALTSYRWDDVPTFFRWKFGPRLLQVGEQVREFKDLSNIDDWYRTIHLGYIQIIPKHLRSGLMTGREVMQIFGTECIREVFGNVWAKATVRQIKKRGKRLSVITDNRFPNEIDAVLDEPQGYVIRLTRTPFGTCDLHPSEASLDDYDWNRERCYVLDNSSMSIEEQNEAVIPVLCEIFDRTE